MECVVHIVPVGHTPETLSGSIRNYPVGRVVLVRGKDKSLQGAKEAEDAVKTVKKDLGSIPCEDLLLDIDDIESAALTLVEKINMEKSSGCDVLVNLSGSLRSLDVAAYLAALSTGTPAYMGLPEYKNKKVVGVRKVVEVPLMPLKGFSQEKMDIIRTLGNAKDGMMLADLMKKVGRGVVRESSISERSRLSYHISDLKRDGLVDTVKEGRNLRVSLTFAGRLYFSGL